MTWKIYEVARNEKCGGCLWNASKLYVIASSEEEAKELYKAFGGLCAECLIEMIINEQMEIRWKPRRTRKSD